MDKERVVKWRVKIGIEEILIGGMKIKWCRRMILKEDDNGDGIDEIEEVFKWKEKKDRWKIRVGKCLEVKKEGKNGERVNWIIKKKKIEIGKVKRMKK